MERHKFSSHQMTTVIIRFNGRCEFSLCHLTNYARDRAAGKYTEGCRRTCIFENLDKLWEKTVRKPFHQVGYSSPLFDQATIGIVSGSQFGINALRYSAFHEFAGTQELRCHFAVTIVILFMIQVFPFSPSFQGILVNETERDALLIQKIGYITPIVTSCFN